MFYYVSFLVVNYRPASSIFLYKIVLTNVWTFSCAEVSLTENKNKTDIMSVVPRRVADWLSATTV